MMIKFETTESEIAALADSFAGLQLILGALASHAEIELWVDGEHFENRPDTGL